MNDIRSLLDEADPLRREPELSDTDAARMRAVVVGASRQPARSSPFWSGAFAVAGALVLVVVAGMLGERRSPDRPPVSQSESAPAQVAATERRQLQFSTPGGTRIIWTLDPGFQVREGKP